jgi:membrane-associated phospholipid phosphatase
MDAHLFRDINSFAIHTHWAHGVMKLFANDGVGLFGLFVLAAWWVARSGREARRGVAASAWTAAATVIAVGLNQAIVSAVHRPRPYQTLRGVEVLVSRSHDFSFPSDHAVTAGAAAAGLWLVARQGSKFARRIAIGGTVVALLLAFARVYVGAHYPGDVVAGLAVGAAVTVIGWVVLRRPLTAIVGRIGRLGPLRPFVEAGAGKPLAQAA